MQELNNYVETRNVNFPCLPNVTFLLSSLVVGAISRTTLNLKVCMLCNFISVKSESLIGCYVNEFTHNFQKSASLRKRSMVSAGISK